MSLFCYSATSLRKRGNFLSLLFNDIILGVKTGNIEIVNLLLSYDKLDIKIPSSIRERITDKEGIYESDEAEPNDKNALELAEIQKKSQLIQILKYHFK